MLVGTVRLFDDRERWPGGGALLADRYRLEDYLPSGSAAALWRAVDAELGRSVAVKILLPHHCRDDTVAERFRREALAVATVRSPHVVRIFDVARHGRAPCLVMEYVDGPALAASFRGRQLDGQVLAAVGYRVAAALAAVHAQGLVLLEAATGRPVFHAVTAAETANARLHQDPPPVTDQRPDIPPTLAEIIARATRRNRDARHLDGRELAHACRRGGLRAAAVRPTGS